MVAVTLESAWQADVGGRLSSPVVAGGVVLVASIDMHTIHALSADSGKKLWRRTVGGRVDSPPTIHNGLAIFGSADGFVYCLRLADGGLVWRLRAGPRDRRTVAFGQVESVWPATGSVLVHDDVVYCTAGRSSYLDGGMVLYRLDPATGRQLGRTSLYNRDATTGQQPESIIEDVELPGALPDVLVCDGQWIYLRDKRMDLSGAEKPPTIPHLYSSAGLLDDTWWHRTYWMWAERAWGRASGWHVAAAYRPSGRILVADDETVFGYGRKRVTYGGKSMAGYHLFRADKRVKPIEKKLSNNNKALVKHLRPAKVMYRWSRDVPIVARAMVLAGETLFAAGADGENGAAVMAFAVKDGADLGRCKINSEPVFDGLIAANGRLYLSARDGHVICLKGK